MNTTDFFTDSQAHFKEFNESQERLTELWSESQKQLSESQKQLFQTWMNGFSGKINLTDFSAGFDTLLTTQHELINSTLNAQKTALHLAMETQKQVWDSYFKVTRKMAQAAPKS